MKPFVKGQTVWRPATCGSKIEEGEVWDAREEATYALFPTDSWVKQYSNQARFFHTQSDALCVLASRAAEKADAARREAAKWDRVNMIAMARAVEEPDALPPADPKEAQNDGDPIRDAAVPPGFREHVLGVA